MFLFFKTVILPFYLLSVKYLWWLYSIHQLKWSLKSYWFSVFPEVCFFKEIWIFGILPLKTSITMTPDIVRVSKNCTEHSIWKCSFLSLCWLLVNNLEMAVIFIFKYSDLFWIQTLFAALAMSLVFGFLHPGHLSGLILGCCLLVSGPVQFEREEEDPFGLDQFLDTAKRASGSNKRSNDDRDRKEKDGKRSRKDYWSSRTDFCLLQGPVGRCLAKMAVSIHAYDFFSQLWFFSSC